MWKYVLQNKYVDGIICKEDESSEDEDGGSIIINKRVISGN
mgnify:FL=1